MTAKSWFRLLLLALFWGGSFIFNRLAIESFPPATVVAGRVMLAALILNIIRFAGKGVPTPPASRAGEYLLMGLLNNVVPMVLIVWAQTRISPGTASILNASTPLFTILLAHFLTADERLNLRRGIGTIVGFLGVIVLLGTDYSPTDLPAQAAVLGAALSYAAAGVYGRRFGKRGEAPLAVAAGQLAAASVILLPMALILDRPWEGGPPEITAVLSVAGLAVFSTAAAYILYFRLLDETGAGNTLLVTMIIPFFAMLLGTAILGQAPVLSDVAALAILVIGLLTVDGRLFTRRTI